MKFLELLNQDKKIKIFVAIGIIGVALIALTTFIPEKQDAVIETKTEATMEDYEQRLENQILELVTSIQGVGEAKVMITLKNGVEYVYAKEEKQNTDTTNGALGDNQTVQQRDNYEQKTILVEDQDGRKKALIRTTLEPTVRGVVIVCQGGDDIYVQQNVIDAVKTALGIGSDKVCVTTLLVS